ncbi:MAG: LamG domain-containing protein, partial [Sedimentisphaerales bacterium]|nr:LamG domain-containing protein [Sedimentisphaerales bacterium]
MFKKYLFVISSLLLLFSATESAQCELVAWYKLNGNGQDSSGNGFHGTEQNGPLTYTQGIHGQAAQFNGTNQYIVTQVTAATLDIDGAKPKTVMAWVNNGNASNTGAVWDVSSTSNRVGQGQTFSLRGNNAANSWMVQLWSMDENPTGMVDTVGTWTHIAFVYNGTTLTVYSDGIQVFSGAKALALGTENAFRLGQFYDPGGTTYYFNGLIDDVKVYNTALSESEVKAAMKSVPEGAASEPNPENEETDVVKNTILSWKTGEFAADGGTHNVFIGTNFNDVNNATIASHDNVTLTEGLDVNNFDPGSLEFGAIYYWRVDEVNAPSNPGTYTGTVWSFTVEPYALKLPAENITATAISSIKNNDPNDTI